MAQSPAAFFCAADPTADGHRGATGFRGFGDFSVDLLLHTGYGGGGENLLPTYVLCHVSRCMAAYTTFVRELGERDPTTRRLLLEILADTERHASELADYLKSTTDVRP